MGLIKLVSRAVPHDCTQLYEGCEPSVLRGLCLKSDTRPKLCFVALSLSPKGCRRVLTPRCSMLSHLQKEQALGGFEPPSSRTYDDQSFVI